MKMKNEDERAKEIKKEMAERDMQDSFLIEAGTAAKGIGVKLKCYFNALDIDDAEMRVKNTLKIRQFLLDKNIIQ